MAEEYLAAVLVRGLLGSRRDTRDTLFMLRLRRKHACVIVPASPARRGMLMKCKDYITYGQVSKATIDELKKARKPVHDEDGTLVFSLAPPKGVFERKGIKKPFTQGGALGYRGKMDALIKKML